MQEAAAGLKEAVDDAEAVSRLGRRSAGQALDLMTVSSECWA